MFAKPKFTFHVSGKKNIFQNHRKINIATISKMFPMFRSSKARTTFRLSKRNSVCRSGRAMKFIGSRVNRTSLVSPVIELHKMLRAAAPVTFCRDQLGESDKKYDERPVTGERLTQRIIVQRYPKRKNSRDRNKLYAKNILRRSIVPS